jgi:hypothetical protein
MYFRIELTFGFAIYRYSCILRLLKFIIIFWFYWSKVRQRIRFKEGVPCGFKIGHQCALMSGRLMKSSCWLGGHHGLLLRGYL